jgi:hypothetical protein
VLPLWFLLPFASIVLRFTPLPPVSLHRFCHLPDNTPGCEYPSLYVCNVIAAVVVTLVSMAVEISSEIDMGGQLTRPQLHADKKGSICIISEEAGLMYAHSGILSMCRSKV